MAERGSVTALLAAWRAGDDAAGEAMWRQVQSELGAQAARYLRRERAGHTLQPTALVNEAWLRLVDQREVDWQGRAHFLAVAATVMRRILVDHGRRFRAEKRGGDRVRVTLGAAEGVPEAPDEDVVAVDEALRALEAVDPRQARVVELRWFGGLTVPETAEAMGISPATVKREWDMARAWLLRAMRGADGP